MTYSATEIKELGRSTCNDTHNLTSLIRTPPYLYILQTEEAFTVEGYKQTNKQTNKKQTQFQIIPLNDSLVFWVLP